MKCNPGAVCKEVIVFEKEMQGHVKSGLERQRRFKVGSETQERIDSERHQKVNWRRSCISH